MRETVAGRPQRERAGDADCFSEDSCNERALFQVGVVQRSGACMRHTATAGVRQLLQSTESYGTTIHATRAFIALWRFLSACIAPDRLAGNPAGTGGRLIVLRAVGQVAANPEASAGQTASGTVLRRCARRRLASGCHRPQCAAAGRSAEDKSDRCQSLPAPCPPTRAHCPGPPHLPVACASARVSGRM